MNCAISSSVGLPSRNRAYASRSSCVIVLLLNLNIVSISFNFRNIAALSIAQSLLFLRTFAISLFSRSLNRFYVQHLQFLKCTQVLTTDNVDLLQSIQFRCQPPIITGLLFLEPQTNVLQGTLLVIILCLQ